MKCVHELKRILEKELDNIVAKGTMSPAELENSKRIVEIFAMVKALDSDEMMYEDGHSGYNRNDYRFPSQRYVDWGYGRSYDGRYDGYTDHGRSYGGRMMRSMYSGHEPIEYIISEMRRLHAKTSDDEDRQIIADCIEQLEH